MSAQDFLIYTNDNCTGCNRCISACTVPEANIAVMEDGKNKIYIDGAKCINCGQCIEACPHNARDYTDDTDTFFQQLDAGKPVSVLVAPAARANFPELAHLMGALKKLGVKAVYDTSFGADICTWAYLRYIGKSNKQGLISQPCPAVVNYIERHDPDLLPMLIPVHSPMMCAAIYMRKYAGVSGDIAFLSPCIAKKNEIDDPNTKNAIQYNVTYRKLAKVLQQRGIDYRRAEPVPFDNPQHGLGAVYSMPGGLRVNVARHAPDAWVYQVEGQPKVKHFLDQYGKESQSNTKPLLVDILNCAEGCNLGTGALCGEEDSLAVNRTMYQVTSEANQKPGRSRSAKYPGMQLSDFDKTLTLEDFIRPYSNKFAPEIRVEATGLEHAFQSLYKDTPESRHIDCCSCGFETCEAMAGAIAKNINHPENCVEYHKSALQQRSQEIEDILSQREQTAGLLKENAERIFSSVQDSAVQSAQAAEKIESINEELSAVEEVARRLSEVVENLADQINQYENMGSKVVSISTQTRLLSMNAAVEAAHAGAAGKGFAVVADEMRELSDKSSQSAKDMLDSNQTIFPILEEVRSFSNVLNDKTQSIAASTREMHQAVQTINETEQHIESAAAQIVQD